MHIHKPNYDRLSGNWNVRITESRSPLSNIIEVMIFDSAKAAHDAYRQAMKEVGLWR